jgi:hypothetical protein
MNVSPKRQAALSRYVYISDVCQWAPSGRILMELDMFSDLLEMMIYSKFHQSKSGEGGLNFWVQKIAFPHSKVKSSITLCLVLTRLHV